MINDKTMIDKLLKDYGSPLYVFREQDFIDNFLDFYNEMKKSYDKYQISYSYKTNYAPYICKIAKELGAYAEVVSDMEYHVAKIVGYEDNHIIYNGPIKGDLAKKMVLNGGILNIDNLEELEEYCEYARSNKGKQINVGLRLNIDIEQNFVSRFGIDTSDKDLEKALNKINDIDNLHIVGLHCHIGRSRSVKSWENRANAMLSIVDKYFKDKKLEYIDLGSGMFAKMEESFSKQFGDDIPGYKDYAQAIGKVFNSYYANYSFEDKPILFTEPGTTVINSYVDFVAEVKSIKHIKGKIFIVLNCSKHNLGEVCTLKKLPICIYKNSDNSENVLDADMVGYTCLEHDVMYSGFDGEIGVGDYVVFGNVGGYSNVSKPPFISPNCAMISIKDNKTYIIKNEETFDDVLCTYVK